MSFPDIESWTKTLRYYDTPFLNQLKKHPLREQRPIIGYTKDRRRGLGHVFLIGERIRLRVARLVPVDVCDEDGNCTQYWQRNQWKWLWTVLIKAACRAPQPIYDMEWVDPNPPPTKVLWGWSATGIPVEEKPEVDFNYFADMEVYANGEESGPGIAGADTGNGSVLGAEETDG